MDHHDDSNNQMTKKNSTKMSPTPFHGVVALEEGEGMEFPARNPMRIATPHRSRTGESCDDGGHESAVQEHVSATTSLSSATSMVRSRRGVTSVNGGTNSPVTHTKDPSSKRHHKRRSTKRKRATETSLSPSSASSSTNSPSKSTFGIPLLRLSTLTSCMGLLARLLFWSSAVGFVGAVGWYSYELQQSGTDPHLIAWFSAGAFVLFGFPVSMYGIVMHLANYNEPKVQMYVVRILWMVPIYSIESWLCLRYKDYAIYIETLRDCYESYVLYSFLQYLIQVLGGEEALILMLKDKSPTRGVHMWGLQWCVKPWLMGQPVRRTVDITPTGGLDHNDSGVGGGLGKVGSHTVAAPLVVPDSAPFGHGSSQLHRVHWTSPFFVQCKFGVLQYVLLKFVCSIVVAILELCGLYHEGNFGYRYGYLYICVVTNTSQCWALYCMIFFYYACKNELASIRPVGKFLSVKALVFFTWWQSVAISILYQADFIPHYQGGTGMGFGALLPGNVVNEVSSAGDNVIAIETIPTPLTAQEALALDEFGGAVLQSKNAHRYYSSYSHLHMTRQPPQKQEWTPEDVAKGMQDYLVCIEMFAFAIIHIFVFSYTEYDPQAVEARHRSLMQQPHKDWNKRLGRKWKEWDNKSAWSGTTRSSQDWNSLPKKTYPGFSLVSTGTLEDDELLHHPLDRLDERSKSGEDADGDDDVEDGTRERTPLLATNHDDDGDHDDQEGRSHGSLESIESSDLNDESSFSVDSSEAIDDLDEECPSPAADTAVTRSWTPGPSAPKTGFVKALWDSAIPQDLRDNTVGIIKGDYVVEKKTLLHHAATSDSYDLFSRFNKPRRPRPMSIYTKSSEDGDVDR